MIKSKYKMNNLFTSQRFKLQWSFILVFIPMAFTVRGQTIRLSLDSCQILARINFPLVKQINLVEKAGEYNVANAARGFLPQISINGQATYQSDVTGLPISLPMVSIKPLSKDQYKIYSEINQPLTDLYTVNQQKKLAEAATQVDRQKLEAELYKLKERINQLYFGILLLDAQEQQTLIMQKDLESALKKSEAAFSSGLTIKSGIDLIRAEKIKVSQKLTEIQATREAYMLMLKAFTGIQANTSLKLASPKDVKLVEGIQRPEIAVYEKQKAMFKIQENLLLAKNLPRFSLFLQTGYGRPALNMLSNDFDFYYIGGVRLTYAMSGLYTRKKEKMLIRVNNDINNTQEEVFLFNTQLQLTQQKAELHKYQELIHTDDELIEIREQVRLTSDKQLENGTITTYDYLSNLNACDQARLNKITHQIQLLMAMVNYQTTGGN